MLANPSQLLLAGNSLLGDLEHRDFHLILPHLSRVRADRAEVLYSSDDPIDWIYFPETAIVAFLQEDGSGRSVETGLVGREGFVGWPAIMGGRRSPCRAVVQLDGGTLLRVGVHNIEAACQVSPSLSVALFRFVGTVMAQMSCSMLANASYPLASRLARWLLMRHDRLSVDELQVHHDEISANLCVRRASITDCLHVLEGDHLVRSRRGKILICDRAGLEKLAGAAYGHADERHRTSAHAVDQVGLSDAPVSQKLQLNI